MNPFATTAASNAEYLRAFPRTTYQRAPPTTSSYYLLPPVAKDAVSIFTFKPAVRRRPLPNGALLARSARGGLLWCPQTVISEPTNVEIKASISALSLDTPSLCVDTPSW